MKRLRLHEDWAGVLALLCACALFIVAISDATDEARSGARVESMRR